MTTKMNPHKKSTFIVFLSMLSRALSKKKSRIIIQLHELLPRTYIKIFLLLIFYTPFAATHRWWINA